MSQGDWRSVVLFQAILKHSNVIFDNLEGRLSSDRSTRFGAAALVVLFLGAVAVIEAGRQGWVPQSWSQQLSGSHFHAISFVFTVLLILEVIGVVVIWDAFSNGGGLVGCFRAFYSSFFISFYTILIFADVLVVLASLRYSRAYDFAFRYFGFTVATVMIRLALTAPRFIDAAIGVGTMIFALCLIWVDDRLRQFFPHTADDPQGRRV